jgi:hypothetical protein
MVLAVVLTLAACGSNAPTEPSLVGRYRLTLINGVALPTSVTGLLPTPVTVRSGELNLTTDIAFASILNVDQTVSGSTQTTTLVQSGTYTASGDRITFTRSGSAPATGTVSSGTISVSEGSITFVFTRL